MIYEQLLIAQRLSNKEFNTFIAIIEEERNIQANLQFMEKYSNYTDNQLLEQMQADNMLALDVLYGRYQKRLFHFANYILKSQEDSENIVHEVFLKTWENRYSIQNLRSYIFSITYNATISLIRKKIKDQKFLEYLRSLPPKWEDPVDIDLEYEDLKDKVNQIVHSLPERQRTVYLFSRKDGLTYREISEKMNLSVNTVENHMVSALRTIRKELKKLSILGLLFACLFI